jgi:hypothetical protein
VTAGWCGAWLAELANARDERERDAHTGASWRPLSLYAAVGMTTSAILILLTLAQGTTAAGLWRGLVTQHRPFIDLFYHHPPLPLWGPIIAVASLAACVWSRRDARALHVMQWASLAVLLCAGVAVLRESFVPMRHGLDDRAAAGLLAACSVPLSWGVLRTGSAQRTGRRMLCLMAVLQPLAAHPTPGTQLAIGTLPALLVMIVLAGDLWTRLEEERPEALLPTRQYLRGLAAIAVLTLVCRDAAAWRQWQASVPLGLPGAERLRLSPAEALARRRVVEHVRTHADAFVASPTGCCSFYLWSGITPPTTRNVTFWEVQLSPDEQRAVIDKLERAERPCLIVDRLQAPVIYRQAPLYRYLSGRFTHCAVTGPIEVWTPPPAVAAAWD